ncbi:MAG: sigma-54 interaction domain-containing protein, partial [Planctomycetaceae bacterium]
GSMTYLWDVASETSKELLAQILHENGPRRTGPMIRVHCASLAAGLLESELFGHVKGAFTGAHRDRPGRFQMADGGTLFLDEIGDVSGETQVKLLRVLQEREFEPVGGTETVSVNVRVIAATNRNLEQLIADGTFREDLYYRLNVVSLTLPPLRERTDDVYELALHFLNRAAQSVGKRVSYIEDDALALLERYAWPGNVRELENVIERAVVMSDDNHITPNDLPMRIRTDAPASTRLVTPLARHGTRPSKTPTDETARQQASPVPPTNSERDLLLAALRESDGNKAEAARRLELPRSTYYSKLKKYGID